MAELAFLLCWRPTLCPASRVSCLGAKLEKQAGSPHTPVDHSKRIMPALRYPNYPWFKRLGACTLYAKPFCCVTVG